jgi:pimeloyl-ACP methyl ester carboxylesterase
MHRESVTSQILILSTNIQMKLLVPNSSFRSFWFVSIVGLLLVASCKNSDPETKPKVENEYLVDTSSIVSLSKEQLVEQIRSFNPQLVFLVKNGVRVVRLTYKTKNSDGAEITASGAMIIPATIEEASLISVQHGTITDENDAPSNFQAGTEANTAGSLFAGLGYIIVYPDYIGYGASKAYPHPYEHRATLASASLDMLRAAKEYLAGRSDIKWNKKLYIAGYSEGGFATLSLQKKIEEEAASEFNLRASSCGAGAYDKTAFMKHIINNTTIGRSNYNSLYLWVLLTYDRIYGLNRAKSTYFNSTYSDAIQANGQKAVINGSFNKIFQESFVKGLNDGTDQAFVNAIADNNVYDWKPVSPTKLFHGDADQLVFYFNSQNAYNAMRNRGATNVTLETLKGKDHSSAVNDFLLNSYAFFSATP